jgi:hypothetical protein
MSRDVDFLFIKYIYLKTDCLRKYLDQLETLRIEQHVRYCGCGGGGSNHNTTTTAAAATTHLLPPL